MIAGFYDSRITLYIDNSIMSIKLAILLHKIKIGCIGTIIKNRTPEKEEFQEPKNNGDIQSYCCPQYNIIITYLMERQRYCQNDKYYQVTYTQAEITKFPDVIEDYNKNARGVNHHCNRMITQFRYLRDAVNSAS